MAALPMPAIRAGQTRLFVIAEGACKFARGGPALPELGPAREHRGRLRMRINTFLVAGLLALAGCGSIVAQDTQESIDGNSSSALLKIARTHGPAKLTQQENGDPVVHGLYEGIRYNVYFMNCTDGTDCSDVNFYTGFQDIKPGFEVMNEWNYTKRFGKAYIDNVGDVNVEWDVSLEHGLNPDNLEAVFSRWTQVIDQFSRYVGWQ